MAHGKRPLSPDLQIYRPQLTSVLSITHRLTGIALCAGTPLLVWWLIAAAMGPQAYEIVHEYLVSLPGRVMLFCWTFAFFFHLCNGIRHLFWDVGYGFELKTIYISGWSVVGLSIVMTFAAWIISFRMDG